MTGISRYSSCKKSATFSEELYLEEEEEKEDIYLSHRVEIYIHNKTNNNTPDDNANLSLIQMKSTSLYSTHYIVLH